MERAFAAQAIEQFIGFGQCFRRNRLFSKKTLPGQCHIAFVQNHTSPLASMRINLSSTDDGICLLVIFRSGLWNLTCWRVFLGLSPLSFVFGFSLLVEFALPFLKRVWVFSHTKSLCCCLLGGDGLLAPKHPGDYLPNVCPHLQTFRLACD